MYPTSNPTILAAGIMSIPRIGAYGSAVILDWRVLVFTLALSMTATILFGLVPALQVSRTDLQLALKQTGATSNSRLHQSKVRGLLVVSEMAFALMLLIGAALLIRTSLAIRAVQPGFDTHHVLTMRMSVSGTPFDKRAGIERLTRDGLNRILGMPGVESASTTCCMPIETVCRLHVDVLVRSLSW